MNDTIKKVKKIENQCEKLIKDQEKMIKDQETMLNDQEKMLKDQVDNNTHEENIKLAESLGIFIKGNAKAKVKKALKDYYHNERLKEEELENKKKSKIPKPIKKDKIIDL